MNDESLVERRDVTLGPRVKAMRIIDAGLAGSERVIVRGLQRARPGITVVAEDADAGGAPAVGRASGGASWSNSVRRQRTCR